MSAVVVCPVELKMAIHMFYGTPYGLGFYFAIFPSDDTVIVKMAIMIVGRGIL
jgi:hypothetical protein